VAADALLDEGNEKAAKEARLHGDIVRWGVTRGYKPIQHGWNSLWNCPAGWQWRCHDSRKKRENACDIPIQIYGYLRPSKTIDSNIWTHQRQYAGEQQYEQHDHEISVMDGYSSEREAWEAFVQAFAEAIAHNWIPDQYVVPLELRR
jgi:hypothetical protein